MKRSDIGFVLVVLLRGCYHQISKFGILVVGGVEIFVGLGWLVIVIGEGCWLFGC
jgi:hypothetical protein